MCTPIPVCPRIRPFRHHQWYFRPKVWRGLADELARLHVSTRHAVSRVVPPREGRKKSSYTWRRGCPDCPPWEEDDPDANRDRYDRCPRGKASHDVRLTDAHVRAHVLGDTAGRDVLYLGVYEQDPATRDGVDVTWDVDAKDHVDVEGRTRAILGVLRELGLGPSVYASTSFRGAGRHVRLCLERAPTWLRRAVGEAVARRAGLEPAGSSDGLGVEVTPKADGRGEPSPYGACVNLPCSIPLLVQGRLAPLDDELRPITVPEDALERLRAVRSLPLEELRAAARALGVDPEAAPAPKGVARAEVGGSPSAVRPLGRSVPYPASSGSLTLARVRGDDPVKVAILQRLHPRDLLAAHGHLPQGRDAYCCPFHDDRHPSFSTFDGRDGTPRWWCFPCGFGGNVIDLAMRLRSQNYVQARRELQRELGIDSPERPRWRPRPAPPPEPKSEAPPVTQTAGVLRALAAAHPPAAPSVAAALVGSGLFSTAEVDALVRAAWGREGVASGVADAAPPPSLTAAVGAAGQRDLAWALWEDHGGTRPFHDVWRRLGCEVTEEEEVATAIESLDERESPTRAQTRVRNRLEATTFCGRRSVRGVCTLCGKTRCRHKLYCRDGACQPCASRHLRDVDELFEPPKLSVVVTGVFATKEQAAKAWERACSPRSTPLALYAPLPDGRWHATFVAAREGGCAGALRGAASSSGMEVHERQDPEATRGWVARALLQRHVTVRTILEAGHGVDALVSAYNRKCVVVGRRCDVAFPTQEAIRAARRAAAAAREAAEGEDADRCVCPPAEAGPPEWVYEDEDEAVIADNLAHPPTLAQGVAYERGQRVSLRKRVRTRLRSGRAAAPAPSPAP